MHCLILHARTSTVIEILIGVCSVCPPCHEYHYLLMWITAYVKITDETIMRDGLGWGRYKTWTVDFSPAGTKNVVWERD